jgi:hypothetical protein
MYTSKEAKVEVMQLRVFKFDDGDNHYVLTYSEEQARDYFENNYGDICTKEDYELVEITGEELETKDIRNDENTPEYISLNDIVKSSREFGIPRVLASSVY